MKNQYLQYALDGLWNTLRAFSFFFERFMQMFIVVTISYFYMMFYRHNNEINMSVEAFLSSSIFLDIIGLSLILTFFLFGYWLITREKVMGGIDPKYKSSWVLDEKKRFSINESVNFLHTMGKFGFPTIIDPSLWDYKNEEEREICFLKASLYLREVNLKQFTEEDFAKFVSFISPYSYKDEIEIDNKKLEIFNDALPLMEILKSEIVDMTNKISYSSSTLSPNLLFKIIPEVCKTILYQKSATENICSNIHNIEDFSKYIDEIDQHSLHLIKLTNKLLMYISFPPNILIQNHAVDDLKKIASSETKSVKEYYQRSKEMEK